jgi:asparagine N-glycosylation enzyme membrane subunit Stt3
MTAAEVASGKSRSKMAPCERPTCTTIITYYSAVAHIVAGVAIIFMLTFTFFVPYSHTSVSILFSIIYAIAQLVLGSALLCGIFKASRNHITGYLILFVLDIMGKKAFAIYLLVNIWGVPSVLLLVLFYATFYFAYHWAIFYYVKKYNQQLGEGAILI